MASTPRPRGDSRGPARWADDATAPTSSDDADLVPSCRSPDRDGVESWLCDFEWYPNNVFQLDLDTVTDGVQALALSPGVPGIVTGAAYPLGARAP